MNGFVGAFRRVKRPNGSNGNGSNRSNTNNASNDQNLPSRRLEFRIKPVAVLLAVVAVVTWITMALMYFRYDMKVLGFYRREFLDEGPGPAWIPPKKRPIPLEAFPDFAHVGLTARGKLNVKGIFNASDAFAEGTKKGPPVTLMFMHLWKCAGSSLRHMLRDWAKLKQQSIGIVVRCKDAVNLEGKICLQDHQLINARIQGPAIRQNQVLAGHFTWGFQNHVKQPYVMFTTLRNPLELFVSGQQYLNRKATRLLVNAVDLVEDVMRTTVQNHKARLEAEGAVAGGGGGDGTDGKTGGKAVGYIYRLVGTEVVRTKTLDEAVEEAMGNLDTFWLVGVIEQYQGFMAVLRTMMDPMRRHRKLWKSYAVGKYNTSPNGAGIVLAGIDPQLVQEFNDTLSQQWKVYDHAVHLYKTRCKKVLHTREKSMCSVPRAPTSYELTDLQREELYQQGHPAVSFNVSEMVRAQHLWAEYNATHPVPRADDVWDLFQSRGFNLTDDDRREELWGRLGVRKVFHAAGPWPDGFDWRASEPSSSRGIGLGRAELWRAEDLWRAFDGPKDPPDLNETVRYFEANGFNLTNEAAASVLWGWLDLADVFSVGVPLSEDEGGEEARLADLARAEEGDGEWWGFGDDEKKEPPASGWGHAGKAGHHDVDGVAGKKDADGKEDDDDDDVAGEEGGGGGNNTVREGVNAAGKEGNNAEVVAVEEERGRSGGGGDQQKEVRVAPLSESPEAEGEAAGEGSRGGGLQKDEKVRVASSSEEEGKGNVAVRDSAEVDVAPKKEDGGGVGGGIINEGWDWQPESPEEDGDEGGVGVGGTDVKITSKEGATSKGGTKKDKDKKDNDKKGKDKKDTDKKDKDKKGGYKSKSAGGGGKG